MKVDLEGRERQLEASGEHHSTEYVTYRIAGDDVPTVRLLLKELYTRCGDHTGPFMYLPLEIVM